MKYQARTLWRWLMGKSLFTVMLLLNFLSFILISIAMYFVKWFTKH